MPWRRIHRKSCGILNIWWVGDTITIIIITTTTTTTMVISTPKEKRRKIAAVVDTPITNKEAGLRGRWILGRGCIYPVTQAV